MKKPQLELILSAVKGDASSITKVVEQYTPLVHKIVNKYSWMSSTHSREDLVQEGLIGIVKAIKTFEIERGYRFMTWVYPQIRGAVSGLARKENRAPKYTRSLDQGDWGFNLEDPNHFDLKEEYKTDLALNLVITGCGSVDSKRAQIVCDRYGLLGRKALRQGEVARKHGLTKQAVQSHISRFNNIIRERHPELEALVR